MDGVVINIVLYFIGVTTLFLKYGTIVRGCDVQNGENNDFNFNIWPLSVLATGLLMPIRCSL